MKIVIIIFCILLVSCSSNKQSQGNYEETRKLLVESRISEENFNKIFQNDEAVIDDLITALNDKDKNVRNNAQTMIRYIGNPKATKAMYEWLSQNALKEKEFAPGPIPIPINDWEYDFDSKSYMYLTRSYLKQSYALFLDNSDNSQLFLNKLIEQENNNQYGLGKGKKLERLKELQLGKPFQENGDLIKAVLQTPFFQFKTDNPFEKATPEKLRAKLVTYNSSKTRALMEVQNDDGKIEVVVENAGESLWRFYSIIRVSVF